MRLFALCNSQKIEFFTKETLKRTSQETSLCERLTCSAHFSA